MDSFLFDSVQRDFCEKSFFSFVKTFWGVIIKEEPVYNWHIEYLCDELQRISKNIVERKPKEYDLIINIPPGTTKSTICTIMFPVWLWVLDDTIRVITNSYSMDLSIEQSTKSRDIIFSDKFKRLFPKVKLRKDKSAKSNYENENGGARYTTSTGSTITGKHAHLVISDDPLNPAQSSSKADRFTANEHTKTLSSRKVDKENTPTLTIMQRLHEEDVTGYLLSKKSESVRHICLPAEISEEVKPKELKEKYVNGLLDVNRLSEKVLAEAKRDLGSYGYANQYSQKSAPPEGGVLKRNWFEVIDWMERFNNLVWHTAIDSAYSATENNDESGYLQFAVFNNDLLIRYANGYYLEFPELVKHTISFSSLHGYSHKSMIYVEPKASGKSLVQTLKRNTTLNVKEDTPPFKDKEARVNDITPICEARRVKLIRGVWNEQFISQMITFPNSSQDGQVDCLVMAINNTLKISRTKQNKTGVFY
ncbi:phage terminase large subunit [Polaribacter sp. IC073]|uniref:phage terminase large subunit n=1 Tax=Polaribacter sp. IC073 TaxID=2508540 RepID=UPI0011BD5208|nr:phage terminase large subunit [Polaribacter sp. IC073]TXD47357.1 hypothetical protein ES045_12225 [Polaribacter sp. IC073]